MSPSVLRACVWSPEQPADKRAPACLMQAARPRVGAQPPARLLCLEWRAAYLHHRSLYPRPIVAVTQSFSAVFGISVLNLFSGNKGRDSPSPPTTITIHNHLRRFPVEREEQDRKKEKLGMTEKWSSKGGSEIKVKCNGERVPPTVLMSSGRVNRF